MKKLKFIFVLTIGAAILSSCASNRPSNTSTTTTTTTTTRQQGTGLPSQQNYGRGGM